MVTHVYDAFLMKPPVESPDGNILIQFVPTDDDGNITGEVHVFPLHVEAVEQLHKAFGDLLGKKVDVATMQDLRRETSGHSVPGAQPR